MKKWLVRVGILLVVCVFCFVLISQISNKVDATKAMQLNIEKSGAEYILQADGFGEIARSTNEIRQEKIISLPDSETKVIIWNEIIKGQQSEKTIHKSAISLDGQKINVVKEISYDLLLRFAKFDPLLQTPEVPQALTAKTDEVAEATYIVQFVSQPLDEYHTAIKNLGGKSYTFLANHSYLMILNQEAKSKIEQLPFVRWVGRYQPAYKLEEFLLEGLAQNNLPKMRYNLMMLERGSGMQNKIAGRINALGGKVDLTVYEGFRMEATLTAEQLTAIAQENEILFIDRWSAPETDMDLVRNVGGANFIENTLGFRGQGVRAEVLDSGLLLTHTDFNSGLAPLQHGGNNVDSHGTATYGINFARGTTNPAGRGMLPEAQGIFADYDFLTNRYTHTAELKQEPYKAVYQSNSWGNALTTVYNTISADMDDILFINDILVLNSQSNAGTQQSRPQAWAKNVVSIGGIRHFNTATFDDDRWQNGASVGPASDGRIKPDLAHFYDSVFTTTSTNNTAYTSGFGGTSAATPITAGHFGIFFQMWHNGVFGNPTGATVFDSAPHMTTSKAIMINNAVAWSLDAPSDTTRARQGWGRVDLQNLYNNRKDMLIIDESHVLTNLQSRSYNINITNASKPLKATLVFADPKGNPAATQSRINNLSLKVTAPNGTIYWGNNGMLTSPWTASGGTENVVDTVENVFIQNPALGSWTVEVIASELVQDARLETPGVIDADYALVVGYVRPKSKAFDYDGDGKSDISVFRPSGEWFVLQSSNSSTTGTQFGTAGDKPVPGDFDGDSKTDLAVYRNGGWFILQSSTGTFYSLNFGNATDTPVVGDFDADGKADQAVFRSAQAQWFINQSTAGVSIFQFGLSSDIPMAGDFDGDGKTDAGVYRPTGGTGAGEWWVLKSSGGLFAIQFGLPTDKPIAADYTGDGRTDPAVFRPSNNTWYVFDAQSQGFFAFPFGLAGDKQVPADYDGDGKADAAVFRSSTAQWFILQSTNQQVLFSQFGATTDIPTPGAFLP